MPVCSFALKVEVAENEPRLHDFLVETRNRGGSDFHLAVGLPPLVRESSDLVSLEGAACSAADCEAMIREILTDDQWRRLDRFIEQDDYLSEHRGEIAERTRRMCAMVEQTVAGYEPFFDVRLLAFPEFAHAVPIYGSVEELRDRLAPHVRAYTARGLRLLFDDLPVRIIHHAVIFPGYDNIVARAPALGRVLRGITYALERTPLKAFGLSHLLILERR